MCGSAGLSSSLQIRTAGLDVIQTIIMSFTRKGCVLLIFCKFEIFLFPALGLGALTHGMSYQSENDEEDTFDFIVVGAGTAGCVVAGRLSESGKHSVLLLEEGGVPHPDLDVPALATNYLDKPEYSRIYKSTPQTRTGLANKGIFSYIAGKTLGGGSSINGMFVSRGSPHDFDRWSELLADPSWSYSNLLKYFIKSENYGGPFPSDQRGTTGPISISRSKFTPGLDTWLQAGIHLNYTVADPNGPQRVSFNAPDFNIRFGKRVSSYTGYIKDHLNRKNLKIVPHAQVTKILFDGTFAVGVQYHQAGSSTFASAKARKEIVLSAGVFGSSALLLVSGVGPQQDLRRARIPLVINLPGVGANLQDHLFVKLDFAINDTSKAFIRMDRDLNPKSLRLYEETGDGPYSSFNGFMGQAMIASEYAKQGGNGSWPDVQLIAIHSPTPFGQVKFPKEGELNPLLREHETLISCIVFLSRPHSVGKLRLNASAPDSSDPLIDFNYFSDPLDKPILLDGVKKALAVFENTPSYQNIGARYIPPAELSSECGERGHDPNDDYWNCFIAQRTLSGFHGVGSCKMGRGPSDPSAVVDPNFSVIGINNLRVVDASIMPQITNSNLMGALFGIGEKASEIILARWDTA